MDEEALRGKEFKGKTPPTISPRMGLTCKGHAHCNIDPSFRLDDLLRLQPHHVSVAVSFVVKTCDVWMRHLQPPVTRNFPPSETQRKGAGAD